MLKASVCFSFSPLCPLILECNPASLDLSRSGIVVPSRGTSTIETTGTASSQPYPTHGAGESLEDTVAENSSATSVTSSSCTSNSSPHPGSSLSPILPSIASSPSTPHGQTSSFPRTRSNMPFGAWTPIRPVSEALVLLA